MGLRAGHELTRDYQNLDAMNERRNKRQPHVRDDVMVVRRRNEHDDYGM
jgi:hypothetical protein